MALEGGDPRRESLVGDVRVSDHAAGMTHDPSVTFEEYVYYAAITRAEEKAANEEYVRIAGPKTFKSVVMNRFSKTSASTNTETAVSPAGSFGGQE